MPLRDIIRGRTSVETIVNPMTDEVIVKRNDVITDPIGDQDRGRSASTSIRVRWPLTCETARGVCARCYGQDLSTGKLVEDRHGGRHHRGAVDRRAGHAAHDAHVPHRRHRGPRHQRQHLQEREGGTVVLRDCMEVEVQNADGSKTMVALKRNGEIVVNDSLKAASSRSSRSPTARSCSSRDGRQGQDGRRCSAGGTRT